MANRLEKFSQLCEEMRLGPAFRTEFSKMRKIAPRLRDAGLNPDKI